jgi:hypothetical protein
LFSLHCSAQNWGVFNCIGNIRNCQTTVIGSLSSISMHFSALNRKYWMMEVETTWRKSRETIPMRYSIRWRSNLKSRFPLDRTDLILLLRIRITVVSKRSFGDE